MDLAEEGLESGGEGGRLGMLFWFAHVFRSPLALTQLFFLRKLAPIIYVASSAVSRFVRTVWRLPRRKRKLSM